jgi:hypothetical protein
MQVGDEVLELPAVRRDAVSIAAEAGAMYRLRQQELGQAATHLEQAQAMVGALRTRGLLLDEERERLVLESEAVRTSIDRLEAVERALLRELKVRGVQLERIERRLIAVQQMAQALEE